MAAVCDGHRSGQLAVQERPALGGGHRHGQHPANVTQRHATRRQQVHLDAHHDLTLDEQLGLERQRVNRDRHRPLDRVLDADESQVDQTVLDGVEHIGDRRQRHQPLPRQVGLGHEGLLGERALGPQEPDAQGRFRSLGRHAGDRTDRRRRAQKRFPRA
jgi:hypothetical protein